MRNLAAITLTVLGLTLTAGVLPASAAYRTCALRQGAGGPCTCLSDGDGPGQYSTVARKYCRRAAATKQMPAKPDALAPPAAAAAPEASQGPAPAAPSADTSTIETAGTPEPAAVAPASAAGAGRLAAVKARGKLLCGVNTGLLGFSARTESGAWAGLDVDFCRAVAAAVFGDANKVEFVAVETAARFEALKSGSVDILSRNTTWTMAREADLGLEFAGVLYFDGQGFLTSDDRGLVSAQQLAGLKVCVEGGTTTEKNMAYYFKAHAIDIETKVYSNRDEMRKDYLAGNCDALSGDHSALSSARAEFAEPLKHALLPEVISKEPLGPVVLDADSQWVKVVRWTLAGLINAEEVGLDKAAAAGSGALSDDATRLVDGAGASGEKLGLSKTWLRDVIGSVGNYGELFEANVGKSSPLGTPRGINALWTKGGLLYAPPMW